MGIGKFTAGDNPAMDKHPIHRGLEILLLKLGFAQAQMTTRLVFSFTFVTHIVVIVIVIAS